MAFTVNRVLKIPGKTSPFSNKDDFSTIAYISTTSSSSAPLTGFIPICKTSI